MRSWDIAERRIKELEQALKLEERMRRDATASTIAREEALQRKNEELYKENEQLRKQIVDSLQQQATLLTLQRWRWSGGDEETGDSADQPQEVTTHATTTSAE